MSPPKTAVTLYDLPQQKKHAEGALFGALGHANGRAPRELLGNKPRQAIQAALTSDAFFAHHDGFRQSSKRESWKDLVNEASRRPKSLGFIEFEDGCKAPEVWITVNLEDFGEFRRIRCLWV